jgi:hypothetical protein
MMCFTTAVKLANAFKTLIILIVRDAQICCDSTSDPANCPFWLTQEWWILIVFLAVIRGSVFRKIYKEGCCKNKAQYNLVPEETKEQEEKEESEEEDDEEDIEAKIKELENKKKAIRRNVRSKA